MPIELQKRPGRDKWYLMGTEFGENIRQSTGTADRKEAETILAKVRAEIFQRHAFGAQATYKFLEAAQSYLEAGKGGRDDRHLMRLLYKDYKADKPQELTELATTVLKDVKQTLIDDLIKDRFPGGAAPGTIIRSIYVPITAVLRHASKRDMCAVPNFDRPQEGEGRTDWLLPIDAEKFVQANRPHLRPLVVFMIGTGCRLSEALYLDWHEVDLDGGYAIVIGPTDDEDDEYRTKSGKARTVPLSPRIIAELRKIKHRSGPVFLTHTGEAYARPDDIGRGGRGVHAAFARAAQRAGLRRVNPHMTRHTFATWHCKMGTHLFRLMLLGGWSKTDTVKRYSHMQGMLSPADARIIAPWLCGLEPHQMRELAPTLKVVGE